MKEEDIRRIVNEELDKRLAAAIDQLIVGDAETPATTEAGVRRLTQTVARSVVRSLHLPAQIPRTVAQNVHAVPPGMYVARTTTPSVGGGDGLQMPDLQDPQP